MHLSSTRYHHHKTMHNNSTIMRNPNTTMCSHSITLHNITRYLSTMHHKEIEVDIEVEHEEEEDLGEVEVSSVPQLPTTQALCMGVSTSTSDMYVLSCNKP
jgi:hypothetical protein